VLVRFGIGIKDAYPLKILPGLLYSLLPLLFLILSLEFSLDFLLRGVLVFFLLAEFTFLGLYFDPIKSIITSLA
jgi:hypothetical protein